MNFGIIAAGEGSRLSQEGIDVPKPLVEIDGRPMIGRLLDIFAREGGERVVVCINAFMTEVREYLESYSFPAGTGDTELVIKIRTTPSSMHTMHEIAGEMQGRGRWIATTVDTIFRESDFHRYVEAWREAPRGVDAMMAVTDFVDDEKPLWVTVKEERMRVDGFHDRRPENARYISGGIYGLCDASAAILGTTLKSGQSRMRNYQRALVQSGLDVEAFPMGKIIDVDHAADIAVANDFLKDS